MANEVVIGEFKIPEGGLNSSVLGKMVTSQIIDAGSRSAEINSNTKMITITAKGAGFWLKQGNSDVSAAANIDGNIWLPADQIIVLPVDSDTDYVDTAADA